MFRNPALRLVVFYAVAFAFVALNIWFVVKKDSLFINLLPFALAVALLAIFSIERLMLLIVFFTPLSLPLTWLMPGLAVDLFLPTEPLIFGILLLVVLMLPAGLRFNTGVLFHPVSWAIWLYLFWLLVTSITSSMPVVSFKFLLVKIWFITVFYLLATKLFENFGNIRRFAWLYVGALLIVIGYTIFRHTGYGLLNKQAAHFVMSPFYKDHTSYGAVLAMFIPFFLLFSFNKRDTSWQKWTSRIVLAILLVAFVLSYSRAAWLSLVLALGVWVFIRLEIRFQTMLITLVTILALGFAFQKQIVHYLEKNEDESSSNLVEHFSSMTNITSDASNLERINRWACAIRMFRERPVFGYGPGTYMFKYGPYQVTNQRTIISTNAGDLGNAHSEYLGPLAESGLLGMVTFILLVVLTLFTAIHTYTRLHDPQLRLWLLGATIGLVTYYAHGLMNNFLDTDKASVPFWGFTAIIVVLDLHSRKTDPVP